MALKPRGSLFRQLVVFILTMIAATAAIIGSILFAHSRRQARVELEARGGLLASSLAANVRRGVETGNVFRTIEPLAAAVAQQPDVAEVIVVDHAGGVLARTGTRVEAETIEARAQVVSDREMLFSGSGREEARRRIGEARVSLSLEGFERTLRRTGALIVAVIAGMLALGSAAALAFARRLAAPLEELAEAAVRIRRGEYGISVPAHSRDELGSLAEAFNSMSRDLAETTGCLEHVVESLLTAVVVAGADGNIRRVNGPVCGMTGFEASDLTGRPLAALIEGPGPAGLAPEAMARLLRDGAVREEPSALKLKSGGRLPVKLSASLVKDADGRPYAVVLLARTGVEE